MARSRTAKIEIRPVAPELWPQLAELFGPRGACAGCWCMYFKQTGAEHAAGRGASNRRALRRLVTSGAEPGLLAFVDGEPAAWCALEPKERFGRIARSKRLATEGPGPVWSVPCFFVARRHRGLGLTRRLLDAAIARAREAGAAAIEGYPVEPRAKRMPDTFAYHGLASAFREAGFAEVAAPSATRRVMRRELRRRRRTG